MKEKAKYYKGKIMDDYYIAYEDGFIIHIRYDSHGKLANISFWKNKNDIKKFSIRGCEKELTEVQFKKSIQKSFGKNGMSLVKRFEKIINKK